MLGNDKKKYGVNKCMPEKYMREALKEAQLAFEEGEVPIGAVVVCGDSIIGRGHNMCEKLKDASAHAEMIALTAACEYLQSKYLNDCSIYVTIEPCPMCAAALNWAQIRAVIYGANDPKKGFSLFSPPLLNTKVLIQKGVLAQECSDILTHFFKAKRQM